MNGEDGSENCLQYLIVLAPIVNVASAVIGVDAAAAKV